MTRERIAVVCALIRTTWSHSSLGSDPELVLDAWQMFLGELDELAVLAAVKQLALERDHAPGPGAVARVVADRELCVPEWPEVWTELQRHVRRWGWRASVRWSDGRDGVAPPTHAFSHPVVAVFAAERWRELCFGPRPGSSGFEAHYAQMREAWGSVRRRLLRDVTLEAIGAPRRGMPARVSAAPELVALPGFADAA